VFGSGSNVQWNLDGAVISDVASGNSSPTYWDFDSFEEINITTGGTDASQQSAGIQVNLITESGSNTLKGSGRCFQTNQKFQGLNVTPQLRKVGAGAGNPLHDIFLMTRRIRANDGIPSTRRASTVRTATALGP
jgi:hypothetical protein